MALGDYDMPVPQTALSLLRTLYSAPTLSLGCPVLHAALGDSARGLSPQGVTEISGESSAGKTQLCMTLAVRTVLQALLCPDHRVSARETSHMPAADVLFVNSEDRMPTPRLREIAEETAGAAIAAGYPINALRGLRIPPAAGEAPVPIPCPAATATSAAAVQSSRKRFAAAPSSSSSAGASPLTPEAALDAVASCLMSRMLVAEIATDEELLEVLARAPGIAAARGLRLLIVDSIAALFRGEVYGLVPPSSSSTSSGSSSSADGARASAAGATAAGTVSPAGTYAARAARLAKIAAALKALQDACPHVAIVVTNQVSDLVLDHTGRGLLALISGNGRSSILSASAGAGAGAGASLPVGKPSSSASSSSSGAPQLPPSSSFAVQGDGDRLLRPALGPSWDAMITTRIMLTHLRGLAPVEVPAAAAPPLPLELGTLPLPAALCSGAASKGGGASASVAAAAAALPSSSVSKSAAHVDTSTAANASSAAAEAADSSSAVEDDGSAVIARLMATSDTVRTSVREAHLLLSPAYPRRRCRFAVVRGGLRGIAWGGDAGHALFSSL